MHYVVTKRQPTVPTLSLGIFDEPMAEWQRKARTLRIRRERLLKQQLRMIRP